MYSARLTHSIADQSGEALYPKLVAQFGAEEMPIDSYRARAERNVCDSDARVWLVPLGAKHRSRPATGEGDRVRCSMPRHISPVERPTE